MSNFIEKLSVQDLCKISLGQTHEKQFHNIPAIISLKRIIRSICVLTLGGFRGPQGPLTVGDIALDIRAKRAALDPNKREFTHQSRAGRRLHRLQRKEPMSPTAGWPSAPRNPPRVKTQSGNFVITTVLRFQCLYLSCVCPEDFVELIDKSPRIAYNMGRMIKINFQGGILVKKKILLAVSVLLVLCLALPMGAAALGADGTGTIPPLPPQAQEMIA